MISLGKIVPHLKKEVEAFLLTMRKKRMEEQDRDIRLDLDKPEGQVEEVAEAKEEAVEAPTDEVVSEEENRSAYNCGACSGDGLLANGQVCQLCLGTGKN